MSLTIAQQAAELSIGAANVVGLTEKLALARHDGRHLRVKLGIDPTAPDIHLGFVVLLRKLRQFQDAGHHAQIIIGDFTAAIGDPTGRSQARPRLSREQIESNATSYLDQMFHFIRRDRTTVRYNQDWLSKITSEEWIRTLSEFTVAQMLSRDDFAKRYEAGTPVNLHEFVYPVAQAIDSIHVESDVELGGIDQLFNVYTGRTLMERRGKSPQACLLMPLLVGLDGQMKMSKSAGNYIGVRDAPQDIYGKVMSLPDPQIIPWMRLLTDIPGETVMTMEDDMSLGSLNPVIAKRLLAKSIVALCYDSDQAEIAEESFNSVFRDGNIPDDIRTVELTRGSVSFPHFLVKAGFTVSNSEGRRLIEQGGVRINGTSHTDLAQDVVFRGGEIVSVGKRNYVRVHVIGVNDAA